MLLVLTSATGCCVVASGVMFNMARQSGIRHVDDYWITTVFTPMVGRKEEALACGTVPNVTHG